MSSVQQATARAIPGPHDHCENCGHLIVWAKTVAGPNGPGGKSQPFDPVEHPDGNVALFPRRLDRLEARALHKDEDPDRPNEYRGMPHVATCPGRTFGASNTIHLPAEGIWENRTTRALVRDLIDTLRDGNVILDGDHDHAAADLLEALAALHDATTINLELIWEARQFAIAVLDTGRGQA